MYLDCAGTMIPAASAIQAHAHDLVHHLYGNPHSNSEPALRSSRRIESIRARVLRFFNADPAHFDLVFTLNATHALKIVYESFQHLAASRSSGQDGRSYWLGFHGDAHNSLIGGRELADDHRCFDSDREVEEWLEMASSDPKLLANRIGLFAYPGQSNMTGRRLPLTWYVGWDFIHLIAGVTLTMGRPGRIRESHVGDRVFTLFDAAALCTTSPLDLSVPETAPDFTTLSFYKIFGYPDIGALIVRKRSAHCFTKRRYFGGGTVDLVVAMGQGHALHVRKDFQRHAHYELHDQLEDGTLPFHSILALDAAMDVHLRLFGSMKDISKHTADLTRVLYEGLQAIRHQNGQRVGVIYNESTVSYGDARTQGATVAFNIFDKNSVLIPPDEVEKIANKHRIFIRSGGLCNPGGIFTHLQLCPEEMEQAYLTGHKCGTAFNGKPTGVARVSLGAMNIRRDIDDFLGFVRHHLVDLDAADTTGLRDGSDQSKDTVGTYDCENNQFACGNRILGVERLKHAPERAQRRGIAGLFSRHGVWSPIVHLTSSIRRPQGGIHSER